MPTACFISAVTDEFHRKDPASPQSFESYRETLAQAIRIKNTARAVTTQEDFKQGFGVLLETIDKEISRCDLVVHLVGEMSGLIPQPAELRKLHDKHSPLLSHEKELKRAIGDGSDVTYTQWEAYLAYQYGLGRLVFKVLETAPRSPFFKKYASQQASQERHFARLQSAGEHYDVCLGQRDLARKVVESIERAGPTSGQFDAEVAAAIATELGNALRASARTANPPYDLSGVENYLKSVDAVARAHKLQRREVLQAVHQHRIALKGALAVAPSYDAERELVLTDLASVRYDEAAIAAKGFANREAEVYRKQKERSEQQRERAMNAFMLMFESLQLAGHRDDAIRAIEQAGEFVDKEREPVFWADVHEPLAEYLLEHGHYDRAGELIDETVDIREEHQGEGDPALPKSLILWSRWLYAQGQYQGSVDVAARSAQLFAAMGERHVIDFARAISMQSVGLDKLRRFDQAEPLMRRSLACVELHFDPQHPNVASCLNNLALLLTRTGRSVEAEPLLRRALAIDEQSFGPTHRHTAVALNNLGLLLKATDRVNEAELLLRRALAIGEEALGSTHPDLAVHLANLADLLSKSKRLDEAELMLKRASAIRERGLRPAHPNVASGLNQLATLLMDAGKQEEAWPSLRHALVLEDLNPDLFPSIPADLKDSLLRLGDSHHTLSMMERAMQNVLGVDGEAHPDMNLFSDESKTFIRMMRDKPDDASRRETPT